MHFKPLQATVFVFLFALLLPGVGAAQDADTLAVLESKADSLRSLIAEARAQLETVEDAIQAVEMEHQMVAFGAEGEMSLVGIARYRISVFEDPERETERIGLTQTGERMVVLGKGDGYYRVLYDDNAAYVNDHALEVRISGPEAWIGEDTDLRAKPESNAESTRRLNQGRKVFIVNEGDDWIEVAVGPDLDAQRGWVNADYLSDTVVRGISVVQRRREAFVADNPNIRDTYRQAILNGRVTLGMSPPMVQAAIGRPRDINRTTASWGTREQWVYGSTGNRRYVYFRDGVVNSIQD